MPKLQIEAAVGFSDDFATDDHKTRLNILLENCSGRLSVENHLDSPRSRHIFMVDATALGYDEPYNLSEEQIVRLFLIAGSLLNSRYYLTSFQSLSLTSAFIPDEAVPDVKVNIGKHQLSMTDSVTISDHLGTCIISNYSIDCEKFFQIVEKLLRFQIFLIDCRSIVELNIIEAFKSYNEAFTSTDQIACYRSMYSALEKATNSDKDRKKDVFDKKVVDLTGMEQIKINELRKFYNRLKHPLINLKQLAFLKSSKTNIGPMLRELKMATDLVLLSKIS